jgi:hypothetical protein
MWKMPSDARHKFENGHGLRKSMKLISRELFSQVPVDRIWGYPYDAPMTQEPQLGSFVLERSNVTTTNKNVREFIKSTGN